MGLDPTNCRVEKDLRFSLDGIAGPADGEPDRCGCRRGDGGGEGEGDEWTDLDLLRGRWDRISGTTAATFRDREVVGPSAS
jgi:hypothetical protein